MLWLLTLGLTAMVLAALLWPLLRARSAAADRAPAVAVYRDQLREIDRESERGLLEPEQAAAARLEIERRLLAAAAEVPATGAGRGRPLIGAALLTMLLPGSAFLLYAALGSPWIPETPAQMQADSTPGPAAAEEGAAALARMAEALAARLAESPESANEWQLLGDVYGALGRHRESADAFAQALMRGGGSGPDAAALQASHGEALTLASGGQVTEPARTAFEAALKGDPKEPRARYFLGLAQAQAGQVKEALAQWVALEAETPPDAPWRALLASEIDRAARTLGLDPAKIPGRAAAGAS